MSNEKLEGDRDELIEEKVRAAVADRQIKLPSASPAGQPRVLCPKGAAAYVGLGHHRFCKLRELGRSSRYRKVGFVTPKQSAT